MKEWYGTIMSKMRKESKKVREGKGKKEKIRTKHGVKVKNFGQISIEHNSLGHPYKKFQLSWQANLVGSRQLSMTIFEMQTSWLIHSRI